MYNKVVLLSCVLMSGWVSAETEPSLRSTARQKDAQTQAEEWLMQQGESVGWDWRKGRCATIGVSCFDCPDGLSDKEVFDRREKAFFSAYAKMAQEQFGLLQKSKKSEELVQSGNLGKNEGATSLSHLFGDIMRPWEVEASRFLWRTKTLSDDSGNDCELDERTVVVKSENRSRLEGAVQGLERLGYFENWDRKESIYEVAVAGVQVPSQSLQNMQDFMKGASPESPRGDMTFDDWLASRGATTLVGAQNFRDKDGQIWVVGVAPVLGNDTSAAKQRARFWAAFALGANIQSEKRLVQCTDLTSFYGDRFSLDASESVCGESYPEGMVQYRRLSGRYVAEGRKPVDAVVCILRSGTRDFRKTAFQGKVRGQVADDFIAGRKKSLYGLREAIMRRMETLTGPENAHRRKGLSEALEKLNRELKKLEDGASDEVSPLSP